MNESHFMRLSSRLDLIGKIECACRSVGVVLTNDAYIYGEPHPTAVSMQTSPCMILIMTERLERRRRWRSGGRRG